MPLFRCHLWFCLLHWLRSVSKADPNIPFSESIYNCTDTPSTQSVPQYVKYAHEQTGLVRAASFGRNHAIPAISIFGRATNLRSKHVLGTSDFVWQRCPRCPADTRQTWYVSWTQWHRAKGRLPIRIVKSRHRYVSQYAVTSSRSVEHRRCMLLGRLASGVRVCQINPSSSV